MRHDRHPDLDPERARGEIVEEEQRLGALDDEIVHAHGHEVDADRVMPARLGRDPDLGADPIVRGHQHGSRYPAALRSKRPPKPPISASAPGRRVARTSGLIACTRALPASMSTPASR
jgi:hypothetical protein